MQRAIDEFELLHFEFRNQTGGHYARLWQGKCYEELGQLSEALGVYNQILPNLNPPPLYNVFRIWQKNLADLF
ncbi:MAG: hypothetical protein R3C11_12590 [Planctomycetaceae bacterium]